MLLLFKRHQEVRGVLLRLGFFELKVEGFVQLKELFLQSLVRLAQLSVFILSNQQNKHIFNTVEAKSCINLVHSLKTSIAIIDL